MSLIAFIVSPNLYENLLSLKGKFDVFLVQGHNYSMNLHNLLALCFFYSTFSVAAPYSWEDLSVLSSEKNYTEYLDHARDIEPSKRDAAWKNMTEQMGLGYLESLVKKNEISKSSEQRVELISNWPLFRDNEFFIKARDKYFLKQISDCINKTATNCKEMALKYLNNFEHDLPFTVSFLKTTQSLISVQSERFLIAKPLLVNKFSEFYCDNDPLKSIVLNELKLNPQGKMITIHPDCVKAIQASIEKLALEGNNNALALLKISKLLSDDLQQLLSILKFLNIIDLKKNDLDKVIKELEALSQTQPRREKITLKFKDLDPLPGRIFSNSDKVTIGKLKLIERNFPEYIDLYAKVCLSYLQGTKVFKNGNPTPECHNFFKLSSFLETFPQSFKNDYDKATEFMQKKASQ